MAKWQPGQSGNPQGRTKGKTVGELQNEIGFQLISDNQDNIRLAVEKLFEHVKKGSPWAIKAALEYFMGKPRPYMPDSSEPTETSYFVSNMPPEIRQEFIEYLQDVKRRVSGMAKKEMN
jgi:hypothetical protein